MTEIDFSQQHQDYLRIEKAIRFLEDNFRSRPDLEQMANSANLSKFHFARLFKRWAGVTPMQFLQALTLSHTKQQLAASGSLLDASLDAGLSGPGRLHDLFVTLDAVTPGEFKRMGAGLEITYGFGMSPFGECLLARTKRGICFLGFTDKGHPADSLFQLEQTWPGAVFRQDQADIKSMVKRIFDFRPGDNSRPFHLHVKGTNFQVNVWRALLSIPSGQLVSYQDIAARAGKPAAVRASAGAIARNPISFLIPCHRVITKSGRIHQYRWGTARKKAMIGWEACFNSLENG